MTTKKSTSSKQAAPEAEANTQESVDKIHDIIFGTRMHNYERKFSQLEERIMKEVNSLREQKMPAPICK